MSNKEPIVVVCPGRGTYTKAELGYLKKYRPRFQPFFDRLDAQLSAKGEPTITELDSAEKFSPRTHTLGEYASTLIYACSAADFMAIDRDRYEIVAVTGNSMGWYTALWCAGALTDAAAFELIHTMGSMMKSGVIGGQLIYPVVDEDWQRDTEKEALVERALLEVNQIDDCEAYVSIHFGGYAIIGGNEKALQVLLKSLPPADEGRYPFQLLNHAAFHTPLLRSISERALATLPESLFKTPDIALVDGRGAIWQPYATDLSDLRRYTLGHQVYEPYDFSAAVTVALKEFAPARLVLLGPGASSGGAMGQIMVENRWKGITSKVGFAALQEQSPFLLAMGREEQRAPLV